MPGTPCEALLELDDSESPAGQGSEVYCHNKKGYPSLTPLHIPQKLVGLEKSKASQPSTMSQAAKVAALCNSAVVFPEPTSGVRGHPLEYQDVVVFQKTSETEGVLKEVALLPNSPYWRLESSSTVMTPIPKESVTVVSDVLAGMTLPITLAAPELLVRTDAAE